MADPAAGFTPSPSVVGTIAAAAAPSVTSNLEKFEDIGAVQYESALAFFCFRLCLFASPPAAFNRVCCRNPRAPEDHTPAHTRDVFFSHGEGCARCVARVCVLCRKRLGGDATSAKKGRAAACRLVRFYFVALLCDVDIPPLPCVYDHMRAALCSTSSPKSRGLGAVAALVQ